MDIFDGVTHFRCYHSSKKKPHQEAPGFSIYRAMQPSPPPRKHFSITCTGLQIFLEKNQFPSSLVNRTVKEYLQFELPLIGPFSITAQHRFKRLTQRYYIEVIVIRKRLKMKV